MGLSEPSRGDVPAVPEVGQLLTVAEHAKAQSGVADTICRLEGIRQFDEMGDIHGFTIGYFTAFVNGYLTDTPFLVPEVVFGHGDSRIDSQDR